MKKLLTAIALAIAVPAVAHAQSAPAPVPAPKAQDHANMTGMMDCKGMAAMKGHDMATMNDHDMAGMSKADHDKMMQSCAKAPAKDATAPQSDHQNHKM